MRVHSAQAIGVLGGAMKPGEGGIGLQMIAAEDAIEIQSQADTLAIQARDEINVISANAHIDWAAAKSIRLSTAGGANITIAGGNITVQCPGKIVINAGKKSFTGAENTGFDMPTLPRGTMQFDERFQLVDTAGDPVKNVRYSIQKESGGKFEGVTDDNGMMVLQQGFSPEKLVITILGRVLGPETALYRINRIKDAYISEINFLREGRYLTVSLKSYGNSFLSAEKKLLEFVEKIDANTDGNTSAGGFCIGSVNVRGDFKEEIGSVRFRDARHPDTSFGIEIDSFQPDDKISLLSRTSGPDSLLAKMDADPVVLRKRDLTVSGMQAQEWLAWFKLGPNGDQKEFAFTLETMRPSPGKLSPSLQLSFETGNSPASGTVDPYVMADKDAIALWDVVVKSIRPGTR